MKPLRYTSARIERLIGPVLSSHDGKTGQRDDPEIASKLPREKLAPPPPPPKIPVAPDAVEPAPTLPPLSGYALLAKIRSEHALNAARAHRR